MPPDAIRLQLVLYMPEGRLSVKLQRLQGRTLVRPIWPDRRGGDRLMNCVAIIVERDGLVYKGAMSSWQSHSATHLVEPSNAPMKRQSMLERIHNKQGLADELCLHRQVQF
jgi:hypothetical protein